MSGLCPSARSKRVVSRGCVVGAARNRGLLAAGIIIQPSQDRGIQSAGRDTIVSSNAGPNADDIMVDSPLMSPNQPDVPSVIDN